MDLKYFNDLTNQDIPRRAEMQNPDLSNMNINELLEFQKKISGEIQKRYQADRETKRKNSEEFLKSQQAKDLKIELQALQEQFSLIPKRFSLNKKITLNMSAQFDMYDSIIEIIENGEAPCGVLFQTETDLPEQFKSEFEDFVADLNSSYISAYDFLDGTFEGRQVVEFLKKLNDVESKLECLYNAGLTVDDLMEE